MPLCAGAIVLMLRALVKASCFPMVMLFLWDEGDASSCPGPEAVMVAGPLSLGGPTSIPGLAAGDRPRLPEVGASCEADGNVLTSIGTLSLSHVNVSGRSPVTTTHCTLVRSPTFKSRAKLKGVILGGTEKNNTDKGGIPSKQFRSLENHALLSGYTYVIYVEREEGRELCRCRYSIYMGGMNGRNRRNLPGAARRAFLYTYKCAKRFFKRRVPAASGGEATSFDIRHTSRKRNPSETRSSEINRSLLRVFDGGNQDRAHQGNEKILSVRNP